MGLDRKCDQRSKHCKFDLLRNTERTETFNFRFLSQCIIGEEHAQREKLTVCQKVPILDFQSEFSRSKII